MHTGHSRWWSQSSWHEKQRPLLRWNTVISSGVSSPPQRVQPGLRAIAA
eukprot:CAMPEP_0177793284 /NCGR_PEP_ID=MMETSP0491_2-20121128/24989_1 /TAXON_ID=63592 /ORGANISM="Tetraselmis chuii, Strain PLY429" /LENGTH=48 /DNA_ID= /DNA_START= /DNA_END= /DNA_ORIENTATION=